MEENLNKIIETDSSVNNSEIKNATLTSNISDKELSSDDYPYSLSLRREDIEDEKELKKFVMACERLIRMSPEYRIWTDFVREVLGFTICELTNESHNQVTCDIHHHPISLYTITKVVICEKIEKLEKFCAFDIALKVLELHYENRVGFVTIIKSLHEKFHNGFLQIPISLVHGDYKYLIEKYSQQLEESEKDIIDARIAVTFENCGYGQNYLWSRENYLPNQDPQNDVKEIE